MLLSDATGPRDEYSLVEMRVFASADGGAAYPVELEVVGWRSFEAGALHVDTARLLALSLDPRGYGRALGEMLFADDALGGPFRETLAAVEANGGALRLRLRVDPPELRAIAWERVLAPIDGAWQPLAADGTTPFSRFVLAEGWARPEPVMERPLRVLAVIATPTDLGDFGLDPIGATERQALHTLLDGLPDASVTYLETGSGRPPTLNALRAALAEGPHLVHVLCHGASLDSGTVLYLEQGDGTVDVVRTDRLMAAFTLPKTPPSLCFLAACETAARSRHDAFVPLGPALVARGAAQAVVAMSDRVGLATAGLFAHQYYSRLLTHGVVDLAMNEARALVQDQWDWGVPVLFSRLADGQLLDFPVGRPVARLGGIATAMGHALDAARRDEEGGRLIAGLERILAGFETSFRKLVDLGTQYRATGSDPATFAGNFEAYYLSFKAYYDQETFTDEQALLRELTRLRAEMLPRLRPLLDDATFRDLGAELDQMTASRAGLIEGFEAFLEPLDAAVDEVEGLLTASDVAGAIAKKRAFEMQISPSLRRLKTLLGEISGSIGLMQAA